MQLSKEKYARTRIHNGSLVQIENSVTWVTVRHHTAILVMPNSYSRDGIFNQHLTTIKDSYNIIQENKPSFNITGLTNNFTLKLRCSGSELVQLILMKYM